MKCRKAVAAVLLSSAVIISGCSGSGLTKETEESVNNDFSRTDIKAIKAQDDFYGYVNQETLNGIEIGPEMPVAGPFYDTGVEDALMAKIGEIVNSNEEYEEGSCEDIIRKAYQSYVAYDSDPANKEKSAEILKTEIDKVKNAKDFEELMGLVSELERDYSIYPLGGMTVYQDMFDPGKYSIIYAQIGNILGLDLQEVSKDTTKAEDGEMVVTDCLMAAGIDHDKAKDTAHELMFLVIDLAWATDKDVLNSQNVLSTLYFMSEEDLNAQLTNNTVKDYEKWFGIPSNPYGGWVISDIEQIKAFDKIYTEENLELLKAWFLTELITNYGSYIVDDCPDIGKYFPMSGLDADYQAFIYLNNNYKMTVSDIYIKYFYTDEMEERLMELCGDIIESYRTLIRNADWLSEDARAGLETKLDNIVFLTGKTVLENMKNDTDLAKTFDGCLLETSIASNRLSYDEQINNIGKERERNQIGMAMQEVNACYQADNTVIITAAIMNDPWFNLNNSYYENLGGLGAVIAHEIGHGFDSNFIIFNENGVLDPNWLSVEDINILNDRNKIAIDYFENAFKVFQIYSVDGDQTLGENYADLGGMESIMTVCEQKNASDEDYKAVFESYAKVWCELRADSALISQLAEDPHSPSLIRVNAILATTDKFYEIYDIKEGDGMYVSPEDRIGRWT